MYVRKCVWWSWKCVLLVNINVTGMFVNCGSRTVHFSISKVEIISLAFKWLIILRSAIKTHDQTQWVLKNAFAASWSAYKMHLYVSGMQADVMHLPIISVASNDSSGKIVFWIFFWLTGLSNNGTESPTQKPGEKPTGTVQCTVPLGPWPAKRQFHNHAQLL